MVSILFNAGDQVPVIPSLAVVGKSSIIPPIQSAGLSSKVGMIGSFIRIRSVEVVVHPCPGFGVKVYSVDTILFIMGTQVPVIPLFEVVGKGGKNSPGHTGLTPLKAGNTVGVTIIIKVVSGTHCPAEGVKV